MHLHHPILEFYVQIKHDLLHDLDVISAKAAAPLL